MRDRKSSFTKSNDDESLDNIENNEQKEKEIQKETNDRAHHREKRLKELKITVVPDGEKDKVDENQPDEFPSNFNM